MKRSSKYSTGSKASEIDSMMSRKAVKRSKKPRQRSSNKASEGDPMMSLKPLQSSEKPVKCSSKSSKTVSEDHPLRQSSRSNKGIAAQAYTDDPNIPDSKMPGQFSSMTSRLYRP